MCGFSFFRGGGGDDFSDLQPWLNDTTACTYPDPWASGREVTTGVDEFSVDNEPSTTEIKGRQLNLDTKSKFRRRLDDYTGTYTHPGFGDFRIVLNETEEYLNYEFGRLLRGELHRDGESDTNFLMTLYHPLTYRMIQNSPGGYSFFFTLDEGSVTQITVPYFESGFPPVFDKVN